MKNLGKKIAIFYIVLSIIVAILVTTVLYQIIINSGKTDVEQVIEQANKEENIIKAKEILYENGWGKDIISDIKSDVPIPKGYAYVEGNIDDGLIIQEEETKNKLMWIPLDEEVDLSIADEYYKNVEVPEMDANTYNSMVKYGGFYAKLGSENDYTELKDITEEEYETAKENINNNNDVIKPHILYKEEIAQIIAYSDKIGIDLLKTAKKEIKNETLEKDVTYTVDKLVSTDTNKVTVTQTQQNNETLTVEAASIDQWTDIDPYIQDDQIYYIYESRRGEKVCLPKGFKFKDEKNYVKIADKNNEELVYIWVPVEGSLDDVRSKILEKFNSLNIDKTQIDMEFIYSMITEKIPKEMKNSIETLHGFYMAEAELSYLNNEKTKYSTLARNMSEEFSSAIKNKGEIQSDYLRESNLLEDGASAEMIVSEAQKVAKEVQKQDSVKSHLSYGIEYDLAILWLMDMNISTEELMQDSSEIGKYKNYINKNRLSADNYKYLNGIWGLGGNLAELSQERFDFNNGEASGVVLRGGSYLTTGNILIDGNPVHGINTVQDIILEESYQNYNADSIGIRNCLYIALENSEGNNDSVPKEWRNYIKEIIDEVPIPKGFNYIEGSKDEGLVIADDDGNEFVWISTIKEEFATLQEQSDEIKENNTCIDEIQKSIEEYAGFYIGRYEASKDQNGNMIVKKGFAPWNNISLEEAKDAINSYNPSETVTMNLPNWIEYDTIARNLYYMGYDIEAIEDYANISTTSFNFNGLFSSDYGNTYERANNTKSTYETWIVGTGISDYTKTKNIYDIAGNLSEWIDGNAEGSNKILRGGSFESIDTGALKDYIIADNERNETYGFRPAMYIKAPSSNEKGEKTIADVSVYKNEEIGRTAFCSEPEWFGAEYDETEGDNYNLKIYQVPLKDGENKLCMEHGNQTLMDVQYSIQLHNRSSEEAHIELQNIGFNKGARAWYGVDVYKQYYNDKTNVITDVDGEAKIINLPCEITLQPDEHIWIFEYILENNEIQPNIINANMPFEGCVRLSFNQKDDDQKVLANYYVYQNKNKLNFYEDYQGLDGSSTIYRRNGDTKKEKNINMTHIAYTDQIPEINVDAYIDDNTDKGNMLVRSWDGVRRWFTTNRWSKDFNKSDDIVDLWIKDSRWNDTYWYNEGMNSNYGIPEKCTVNIKNNSTSNRKIAIYAQTIQPDKNLDEEFKNSKWPNQSIIAYVDNKLKYSIIDGSESPYQENEEGISQNQGIIKIKEIELQKGENATVNYEVILGNQSNGIIYHRIEVLE